MEVMATKKWQQYKYCFKAHLIILIANLIDKLIHIVISCYDIENW